MLTQNNQFNGPAAIAPGMTTITALSTISMTVTETKSGQGDAKRLFQRHCGPQQRDHCKAEPGDKSEDYGKHNGLPYAQADCCSDDHAGDLSNCATDHAMQSGLKRQVG